MTSEEFYTELQRSDSGREYLGLISLCQSRSLRREPGFELHYVFPRSLGGENTSSNLVRLTVFEHCQAHALLAKALPCYQTLQPISILSNGQVKKLEDLDKVTLEEQYAWSKLRYKALHSPKPEELVGKNRRSHLGRKLTPEQIEKRTAHRRQTIAVTDGNTTKYIRPEHFQEYQDKGWWRGISDLRRARLKESHLGVVTSQGRICVHKGEQEKKIPPEDLEQFLAEGWLQGRKASFLERRQEFFSGRDYKRGSRVRIRKGNVGRIIPREDLDRYLLEGWEVGMVKNKNTS